MYELNDIEINYSTKEFPFEYKWFEYRLQINKELFDNKIIDFDTMKKMEQSILSRLTKIKNEYGNEE